MNNRTSTPQFPRAVAVIVATLAISFFGAPTPASAACDLATRLSTALLDPPKLDGHPVAVSVAVAITNLAAIDQVSEHFELGGYLIARWKDSRFQARAAADSDGILHLRQDEVWTPEFVMMNAFEARTRAQVNITVNRQCEMIYVERFHAKLSSQFHLRRLPFDTQKLEIRIQPLLDESEAVALSVNGADSGISQESHQYESVEEWEVGSFVWSVRQEHFLSRAIVPETQFTLTVTRKYSFYVWKVFVPLVLMVLASWAVFWVELTDLTNQVLIGLTTLLTVIAFGLAVSYTLPRVPYLTYTDAFFLQCYIFVFIAILELMAVHVSHKERQKEDLGKRIRSTSRWAVPVSFLATNIILVVRFLG
ncbi:MAG: hypothetical protein ACREQB_10725 [Candidatus Binataceae bacterium]